MLGSDPPPPPARQVGQPQPTPPSRHGDQGGGGGGWRNGLPCHPPPAKQSSSRPRDAYRRFTHTFAWLTFVMLHPPPPPCGCLHQRKEAQPNGTMPGHSAHHRWRSGGPGSCVTVPTSFCGGEHPPNFTVLGMPECEASPAWEGRQGAETAFVSSGTTVPLSPTENIFPPWPRTSDGNS